MKNATLYTQTDCRTHVGSVVRRYAMPDGGPLFVSRNEFAGNGYYISTGCSLVPHGEGDTLAGCNRYIAKLQKAMHRDAARGVK